ncbi:TPA: type II toxin-antitoxin system RelB/DinJ family antitoxin [Mannheimia haemolytica]
MAETYVRARIDSQLKNQANAIFEQMGLSMSDFIRIALTRAVLERGIPFEMKLPNDETKAVLDDILSRHKSQQIGNTFSIAEFDDEIQKL